MSHSWTEAELTKIGDAEELQISSYDSVPWSGVLRIGEPSGS